MEGPAPPGFPPCWAPGRPGAEESAPPRTFPADTGTGTDSTLPRAIIVAGINENELHNLMNTCRASGMQPPQWAVLTPVSETWTLRQLVAELEAERAALEKK